MNDKESEQIKLKFMFDTDPYFRLYYKKLQIIQTFNKIRNKVDVNEDAFKELFRIYKEDKIKNEDDIVLMFCNIFNIYFSSEDLVYMRIAYILSILKNLYPEDNKLIDFIINIGGNKKELIKFIIQSPHNNLLIFEK